MRSTSGSPVLRFSGSPVLRFSGSPEISQSEFADHFVNTWLCHLSGIQSSGIKWKHIRFKEVKRKVSSSLDLELHGGLNQYAANEKLRFRFVLSCNSNLYPFTLHCIPTKFGTFDEYVPNVYSPSDKLYEFNVKLREIERGLVHSFSFYGKSCELIFVKKLGRGKGKNISYKEIEYTTVETRLFNSFVI